MRTWTFESSSGPGVYTSTLADDGKLLCTCRGWTMRKLNQPRLCKHLRGIISEQQLTVETRGEFVFSVGAASAAPASSPRQEVADRAQTYAPMLASAPTIALSGAAFNMAYRDGWVLEEKLDGHRVIAINDGHDITAFSRPRAGSNGRGNVRVLPPALAGTMRLLAPGVYDGELVVPGGTSSDVVTLGASLVFVLFDVLALGPVQLLTQPYSVRRLALLGELGRLPKRQQCVTTVESVIPRWHLVEAIWKRGGEGAIVKRLGSPYRPGYRSPDWIKVKSSHHATLTVIGFEAGKSGPQSALRLREDATGIETTVKTLGNAMLRDVSQNPASFVGRRVVITYQQRTASGTFRHGIFDHFAGEGE